MLLLLAFVFFSLSIAIDRQTPLCQWNNQSMMKYSFRNLGEIQANIFQNLTFRENQSLSIELMNISVIDSGTFSKSFNLPHSSNLSIEIEQANNSAGMTLKSNAFHHIRIDRLRFANVNRFNGQSVFETTCFGGHLQINELIFDQCGLTGFANNIGKAVNVNHLAIINSPALIQLTEQNLPSFLSSTKSLRISNTALKSISTHTFQAWSLILEELIITNNSNLEIFPSHITAGILMKLNKLDLSDNPIKLLEKDYNWHAYSYTKELLLRNQQLDLFLKTNILAQLPELETIDFSGGWISKNTEDLIENYFPTLTNLSSIDVSYTNLTENMIIDLLTQISRRTNRSVDIHLRGHFLSDVHFCSFFTIFKNAPNLLNLHLDESQPCNCVVDLFFMDKSTRRHCDILTQLSASKCPQNSDPSNSDDHLGSYAFGGLLAGLTIFVLLLLSLGFTAVYRIRRRQNTVLTMEEPLEDSFDAIIDEH